MRVRIYTDGACSKNPGPGGWAAIVCMDEEHIEIKGHEIDTTNNRMELKAVVNALDYIMKNLKHQSGMELEVLSDSAYVVNAINAMWAVKWKLSNWRTAKGEEVKNKDLWEDLLDMINAIKSSKIKLKFTKVKGHSGNFFNEKVDVLAKEQVNVAKLLNR